MLHEWYGQNGHKNSVQEVQDAFLQAFHSFVWIRFIVFIAVVSPRKMFRYVDEEDKGSIDEQDGNECA